MISHKSFVSLKHMEQRSRHEISQALPESNWYKVEHQIESYLLHQGNKLPERFDANSYLRILDAWQSFDLLGDAGASSFHELFASCRHQRYLIFTIDSDLCFHPEEQLRLEITLENAGIENLPAIETISGSDPTTSAAASLASKSSRTSAVVCVRSKRYG